MALSKAPMKGIFALTHLAGSPAVEGAGHAPQGPSAAPRAPSHSLTCQRRNVRVVGGGFTSGGASWRRINDDAYLWGLRIRGISGDPRRFGRVYIGTDGRGIVYGDATNGQGESEQ